jgi:hypothetical protein
MKCLLVDILPAFFRPLSAGYPLHLQQVAALQIPRLYKDLAQGGFASQPPVSYILVNRVQNGRDNTEIETGFGGQGWLSVRA